MIGAAGRTWFITGAGRGLGRAVAEAALDRGDRVVATARAVGALDDLVARHPHDVVALELDVTDGDGIEQVVAEAVEATGGLDVVVNNASYGLVGMAEELSDADVRALLDTNLVGAMRVTRAALPHLRASRGDLVQISTVGAVGTMPGLGLYNASKWGLEGYSEAVAQEVAGFSVRVTIAELGSVATDWAGASLRFAAPLPAYDDVRAAAFGTPEVPWPAGDDDAGASAGTPPAVAAAALLAHLDRGDDRPLRLLVGDDAPGHVAAALALRRDDYARDVRFAWPAAV